MSDRIKYFLNFLLFFINGFFSFVIIGSIGFLFFGSIGYWLFGLLGFLVWSFHVFWELRLTIESILDNFIMKFETLIVLIETLFLVLFFQMNILPFRLEYLIPPVIAGIINFVLIEHFDGVTESFVNFFNKITVTEPIIDFFLRLFKKISDKIKHQS